MNLPSRSMASILIRTLAALMMARGLNWGAKVLKFEVRPFAGKCQMFLGRKSGNGVSLSIVNSQWLCGIATSELKN